jgi:threonine dehydratase
VIAAISIGLGNVAAALVLVAVALAALLAGKAGPATERTVVVVSGGNVDPALYAEILADRAARAS